MNVGMAAVTGSVQAVTFVVDRSCELYAGRLSIEELVATLATASGKLGSNFDYLLSTIDHLDALGVRDGSLNELRKRVEERLRDSA